MRGVIEIVSVSGASGHRFNVVGRQNVMKPSPDGDPDCFERSIELVLLAENVEVTPPSEWPIPNDRTSNLATALPWYVEDYLQQPTAGGQVRANYVRRALQDWGREAFNALFDAPEARAFYDAIAMGAHFAEGVVEIHSPSAGELGWPWEALVDDSRVMLGHSVLVRRHSAIENEQPLYELFERHRVTQMRVLLIAARTGVEDAPYRLTARAIAEVGGIQLQLLRPPTLEQLERVIEEAGDSFDIIHFDCHGVWGDMGDGRQGCFLVLEDEAGQPDPISEELLLGILSKSSAFHIVLNACRSAMVGQDGSGAFSSLATSLLKLANVADVTAMSYKFPLAGAASFLTAYYRALMGGNSPALALVWARDAAMADADLVRLLGDREHHATWMIPVTYRQGRLLEFEEQLQHLRDGPAVELAQAVALVGRDAVVWLLDRLPRHIRTCILMGLSGAGVTSVLREFQDWRETTKDSASTLWIDCEACGSWNAVLQAIADGLEVKAGDVIAALSAPDLGARWLILDHFDQLRHDKGSDPKDMVAFFGALPDQVTCLIGAHHVPGWFGNFPNLEALKAFAMHGLEESDRYKLAESLINPRPASGQDPTDWFQEASDADREAANALLYYLAGHVATTIWAASQMAAGHRPQAILDALRLKGPEAVQAIGNTEVIARSLAALSVLDDRLISKAIPILSLHDEIVDPNLFAHMCEKRGDGLSFDNAGRILNSLAHAGLYFDSFVLHPIMGGALRARTGPVVAHRDAAAFCDVLLDDDLDPPEGQVFRIGTGTREAAVRCLVEAKRMDGARTMARRASAGLFSRQQGAKAIAVYRGLIEDSRDGGSDSVAETLIDAIEAAAEYGDTAAASEWLTNLKDLAGKSSNAVHRVEISIAAVRIDLVRGKPPAPEVLEALEKSVADLGASRPGKLERPMERYGRILELASLQAAGSATRVVAGGVGGIGALLDATRQAMAAGKDQEALRHADMAMTQARQQRDAVGEAVAVSLRGDVHRQLHMIDLARRDYETAIKAFEKMGDRRRAAVSHHQWATAAHAHGLLEEAGSQYIHAASEFDVVGDGGIVEFIAGNFIKYLRDAGGLGPQFALRWLAAGLPDPGGIGPVAVSQLVKTEGESDE